MASETQAVNAWLYPALTAAVPLAGGWHDSDHAPQGTPYPFGLFYPKPTADTRGMGGVRAMVRPEYRVYVVDQTADFGALEPAANTLDGLLHQQSVTTPTLRIYRIVRKQEWRRSEDRNGLEYRQLGGIYLFTVLAKES